MHTLTYDRSRRLDQQEIRERFTIDTFKPLPLPALRVEPRSGQQQSFLSNLSGVDNFAVSEC